jgi:hypothetical protein
VIKGSRKAMLKRRRVANLRTIVFTVGLAFSPFTGLWASELANLSGELLK